MKKELGGVDESLGGARKAAILTVLLGEEVAGQLFQHLTQRDVARIAREVSELGPIDSGLADQVLEEYYSNALTGPTEEGNPELARRMLSNASFSDEIADQLLGLKKEAEKSALGPLLEAPPAVLAQALQDEHPQTTALVLLHLPPRRASELLTALPETARGETVLRMATLRQVRGEVLGEVATSLYERLSSQRNQDSEDGLARTVEVLAKMARSTAREVLDEMDEEHPEEAQSIRELLFTFEGLIGADDRGMQELLRSIDSSKLSLALAGSDPRLADRFLNNLSERAASMLREEMEFVGTPDPAEQKMSRKEILDMALQLEADGRLIFSDVEDDDDGDDGNDDQA